MNVYKFGGASIETSDRMRCLLPVIQQSNRPLLLTVSAYGKTTNALERVVHAAFEDKTQAKMLLAELENAHNDYAREIVSPVAFRELEPKLNELYTEMAWAVDDAETKPYDYIYDQVVSVGELLSTTILALS